MDMQLNSCMAEDRVEAAHLRYVNLLEAVDRLSAAQDPESVLRACSESICSFVENCHIIACSCNDDSRITALSGITGENMHFDNSTDFFTGQARAFQENVGTIDGEDHTTVLSPRLVNINDAPANGIIHFLIDIIHAGTIDPTEAFHYYTIGLCAPERPIALLFIATTVPVGTLINTIEIIAAMAARLLTDKTRMNTLVKQEERFKVLMAESEQGIVIENDEGRIVEANTAAESILGLTYDQMIGRTSMDPRWKTVTVDGKDFPGNEHPVSVSLATGKNVNNVIFGVYQPTEDRHTWIRVNSAPIFEPGRTVPAEAIAFFENITSLKTAENHYRALFQQMLNGFSLNRIVRDSERRVSDLQVLDANPAFLKMTGLTYYNMAGKSFRTLFPSIGDSVIDVLGKVSTTGKPAFFEVFIAETGRYFEITAFSPGPQQCACIYSDLTERKKTEEALRNTQKLEALAVLAGGIAHDFNNLLCGIYGYIDLANADTTDSSIKHDLATALGTIERARGLTSQLLTFTKDSKPQRVVAPIAPIIREMIQFALSGSNCTSKVSIADDLRLCAFDKNQVGQVIDNIIINAKQAMPGGGIVEVTAENEDLSDEMEPLVPSGRYIRISIKDFGTGIQPETLSRIFEPFFTTKEHGHGLGLSTCYSIVRKHDGWIRVESEVGKGSVFDIYLPAALSETEVKNDHTVGIHSGSGFFIVIDDDVSVRRVASAMLKSFGYTPITLKSPDRLISLITVTENERQKIAGALIDLTIPGESGGKQVIGLLKKNFPEIPFFVMSGYAEDPVMVHPEHFGFTGSIGKPFVRNDLAWFLENTIHPADHLPAMPANPPETKQCP